MILQPLGKNGKPASPSGQLTKTGSSRILPPLTRPTSPPITTQPTKPVVKPTLAPQVQQKAPNNSIVSQLLQAKDKYIIQPLKNLPQVHFADKEREFVKPVGFGKITNKVLNTAAGIAQGTLNTPQEAFKGAISLGEHARDKKSTPKQVAGDIAAAVQFPLLFVGGGAAAKTGEGILSKVALKELGKQLGKDAVIGGTFGSLVGLQTGRDIEDTQKYLENFYLNAGIGTLFGTGTAAATHVAIPLAKGMISKFGAIFLKKAGNKPVVEKIHMNPQVAQGTVINTPLENKPLGKEIMKKSLEAQATDSHVAVIVSSEGKYTVPGGQKVDIEVVKPYDPATSSRKLEIVSSSTLSKEDKAIETRFSQYIQEKYPEAVKRYSKLPETDGGRILNVDLARELDDNYVKNRSKSAAVHEPASALIKELYREKLKEVDPEGRNIVMFTAGGTGAGKSTAIKNIPSMKTVSDHAQIIYDTNLANVKPAIGKIQEAIDAGKEVVVTYVHRDPVEALVNGALPRAERMGRTVPIGEHLKTHIGAPDTLLQVAAHFKGNEKVQIRVIDNSLGHGNAVEVSLDKLTNLGYNKDEIEQRLISELEKAYADKRISEQTYRGFKGEQKDVSQTTGRQHGERNGTEPQHQPQEKGREVTSDNAAQAGLYDTPLYHGTTKQFDNFDLSKAGTRNPADQGFAGRGIYFSNSKEVAETFSSGKDIFKTQGGTGTGRIIEAKLDPSAKVLEVNDFGELADKLGLPRASSRPSNMGLTEWISSQSDKVRVRAQELGYDAIKVDGGGVDKYGTPTYELVVFDPKHISSIIDNNDTRGVSERIGQGKEQNSQSLRGVDSQANRQLVQATNQNPSHVAQPSLNDVKTRTFDAKGNETTNTPKTGRPLNTKETQQLQTIIEAKLQHIAQIAHDGESLIKEHNKFYDEIVQRAKGDKVVISSLRTQLDKEMYGIAAVDRNAKNRKFLLEEVINGDPEIGKVVENLQEKVEALDKRLLSASEPPKGNVAAGETPQRVQKQTGFTGASEPVGTGKLKQSRAYKRLLEHLEETDPETYAKVKDDPKLLYNTVNTKYDFENAAKIVEENPDKAYRIAKQMEPAPQNQRWESVNIVLADRALKEGNIPLWKDLEQSRSLAQTRAGQGIVTERGRFDQNSAHTFAQQVLDIRLARIGKKITESIDTSAKVVKSAKEKAVAKIDAQVEKAYKFTQKERAKIDFAQKLLDELTCK